MIDFFDPTLRNVALGSGVLGVIAGALGCFAVLRRQSLLGDALAHAALPGVCLAFLFGTHMGLDPKQPLLLLGGALVTAWIGTMLVLAMTRTTRIKEDAALGIVLSVFFGAGIVLLTLLQKGGATNQAGLDRFLFGQAASLLPRDIATMAILGGAVLLTLFFYFKDFQVLVFDSAYARSLGLPVRRLEILLTSLIVVAVVVGLQTVGVVLMAALIVAPAAAARQWTDRLGVMVLLASGFGALSGVAGATISATKRRLPTGPTIVLAVSALVLISLLFAPRRGIVWAAFRRVRTRRRVRLENLLKDLWRLGELDSRFDALRAITDLMAVRSALPATMRHARNAGLVAVEGTGIRLTKAGLVRAAAIVRNHRIWELYLSRRLDLADDHLHRDAEEMEHALDSEVMEAIDRALGRPTTDPHGRPIPRGVPA
ncbi:MAG: iron chelate uptake ABC transporter family permease subunit [Planctomycetota bacterium]